MDLEERNTPTFQPTEIGTTSKLIDGVLYDLPKGWVVEERKRPYKGKIDKYYYEPHTKKRFRSYKAVKEVLNMATLEQKQAPGELQVGNEPQVTYKESEKSEDVAVGHSQSGHFMPYADEAKKLEGLKALRGKKEEDINLDLTL